MIFRFIQVAAAGSALFVCMSLGLTPLQIVTVGVLFTLVGYAGEAAYHEKHRKEQK